MKYYPFRLENSLLETFHYSKAPEILNPQEITWNNIKVFYSEQDIQSRYYYTNKYKLIWLPDTVYNQELRIKNAYQQNTVLACDELRINYIPIVNHNLIDSLINNGVSIKNGIINCQWKIVKKGPVTFVNML